jgi:Phospholipid methyltransferase
MAAAAGSAVFLVMAPGGVAGLVGWWLTVWRAGGPYPVPVRIVGGVLAAAGAGSSAAPSCSSSSAVLRYPGPPAPTERLVVSGLCRYVRDPVYLTVFVIMAGQALMLRRPVLLAFAALMGTAFGAFVRWYEQPAWPGGAGRKRRPAGGRCRAGGLACPPDRTHRTDLCPPAPGLPVLALGGFRG